jgi:hypothetical protein
MSVNKKAVKFFRLGCLLTNKPRKVNFFQYKYTGGFSPNATANSSTTLTLTNAQTTWIYNGSGVATWTLFNPSGTNQMIWIKNAGTGIITLNAYSGTNIINNSGASVSSITIAIGATVLIQQDGNVKSYQLQ